MILFTQAEYKLLSKVANPQMVTSGSAMSWRLIQGPSPKCSRDRLHFPPLHLERYRVVNKKKKNRIYKVNIKTLSCRATTLFVFCFSFPLCFFKDCLFLLAVTGSWWEATPSFMWFFYFSLVSLFTFILRCQKKKRRWGHTEVIFAGGCPGNKVPPFDFTASVRL